LKNVTKSEAFLKSLKDQAGKPLVFVKDVVTKPVDTLTGIPKGVGRLFGNISESVTTKRNPAQESRTSEGLLVGSLAGSTWILLQHQVLQETGQDRQAASSVPGQRRRQIPISGPASSVITATSLSKSFNNILTTEPPTSIRIINEEKLKQMGINPDVAKAYLDQPIYTPRQNLLLVDSLARLGAATGRDAYLNASLGRLTVEALLRQHGPDPARLPRDGDRSLASRWSER
jgi:hypothetical protein